MFNPPFKLAAAAAATTSRLVEAGEFHAEGRCAAHDDAVEAPAQSGRGRLQQLNSHFHCSVIGTCLGTAELRKALAKFVDVQDRTDIELHHDAVSLAHQGGAAAKALNKLLDQRHDAAIQQFGKVRGADALATVWEEARGRGEIPGAYWALLTHRDTGDALRSKVFGEVHMLSHLVGAANRADIRRLVGLERENAELRERLERQQLRSQETLAERDHALAHAQGELNAALRQLADAQSRALPALRDERSPEAIALEAGLVAMQAERRKRAEQSASAALSESARLQDELNQLQRHLQTLGHELAAAETQLRELSEARDAGALSLSTQLRGRRILYVGGRPSSTAAIRGLVERHGGEFQRHDGGLEDRKGILVSAVMAADLVVFPVDCIDHDSASNLKRTCTRQSIPFIPLRSASVASFAAALCNPMAGADTLADGPHRAACLKHG